MGTVNVVFHGTFAFINWGTIVEVLIPSVGSHVYKYGDRMGLNDLTQGYTYSLSNVTPSSDWPKEKQLGIAIVKSNGHPIIVNRSSSLVFCSILLPAPTKFGGVQWWERVDRNDEPITSPPIFAGADASPSTKTMTSYAGTHVLVYDSDDVNAVRLTGAGWIPTVNGDVVNIHLFAEPKRRMYGQMGIRHSSKSFRRLMKVLNNPRLRINATVGRYVQTGKNPAGITGLPPEEWVSLPGFEELISPPPPPKYEEAGGDPATCASGGWDQGGDS